MLSFVFLLLATPLCSFAAPSEKTTDLSSDKPILTNFNNRRPKFARRDNATNSTRVSCGQYKLFDGWEQEFASQVWQAAPANASVCETVRYGAANPSKAGLDGVISAIKVDLGCSCFFYQVPCSMDLGAAEGIFNENKTMDWMVTGKGYRGWWCYQK